MSVRANGTAVKSGTIANPSSGNEFSNLCAVSDGAFYQTATYFGVVFMESTNNLQSKVNMRYFRTIDWGTTWTNATIQTNYNDFCPSVDYKDGSSDSIYIAVERRFDATNSQIRIVATPFLRQLLSTLILLPVITSVYIRIRVWQSSRTIQLIQ